MWLQDPGDVVVVVVGRGGRWRDTERMKTQETKKRNWIFFLFFLSRCIF